VRTNRDAALPMCPVEGLAKHVPCGTKPRRLEQGTARQGMGFNTR
jgi:hypothetical protein